MAAYTDGVLIAAATLTAAIVARKDEVPGGDETGTLEIFDRMADAIHKGQTGARTLARWGTR